MKILLINVSLEEYVKKHVLKNILLKNIYNKITTSSISIYVIASLTPSKYKINLVDESYNKIDFKEEYDLVGISCSCTKVALRSYKLADMFRKKGSKVVIGGYHPSCLPKEAKQHADSVVIGEAEKIWPQLLDDFENNNLKPFYYSEEYTDPKNIPVLNYKTINISPYVAGISATRGCPYNCSFCSINSQKFGCVFRKRSIDDVIKEIKSMPQKFLYFYDSSFTVDIEYTKELFFKMSNLNKKFRCWMNANIPLTDDDFLRLASEAGCMMIEIGFESLSQKTLDEMGKRTNKVQFYKELIKKIHDYGISVGGIFVFGSDCDEESVFDDTLDNISHLNLDYPRFSILTPFPGTPLYNKLDSENRILTRDWMKYDMGHVVFQPKNMSPEALESGWLRVIKETYSKSNLIKRTIGNYKLNYASWLWSSLSNLHIWRRYHNEDLKSIMIP